MARLQVFDADANFYLIAVDASAGGDVWKDAGLVRLWIANNHPTNPLTVSIKEVVPCNHGHHPLTDMIISVGPTTLYGAGPFDLAAFADGNRDINVEYDFVDVGGQPIVSVAAIRSN